MVVITQDVGGTQRRNSDAHLIFGVGLIGSSICNHLLAKGQLQRTELPFSWNEPARQSQELKNIESALMSRLGPGPNSHGSATQKRHINIVWSAGRSGFASEEDETKDELATFTRIVEFAEK